MTRSRWLERRTGQPCLAYWMREPDSEPLGSVLIHHGFAEHSSCYEHVRDAWLKRGFVVAGYDCRGHGNSEGARGHVDSFDDYVADLEDILAALDRDPHWARFEQPILFAHSTGCLVTLLSAHRNPGRYLGLGLSAPYLELAIAVNPVKKWFARLIANVYAQYSEDNRLDARMLTRDPVFAERITNDPLRLRRVTAGWFAQTLAAQEAVRRAAPDLTLPIFCVVGSADPVAKVSATQSFFERLPGHDHTCRIVPGGLHEVLNDTSRDELLDAFADEFTRWTRRTSTSAA